MTMISYVRTYVARPPFQCSCNSLRIQLLLAGWLAAVGPGCERASGFNPPSDIFDLDACSAKEVKVNNITKQNPVQLTR